VSGEALAGRKVLVTAGPTREHLDPVRFISNPSTGKMGLAVAHAARALGADVTVVLGPVGAVDVAGLEVVHVTSAEQMRDAVLARVADADCLVATAAVSDYRPAAYSPKKLKKAEGPETVAFVRTPDVLAEASRMAAGLHRRPLLVGFAAETHDVLAHAREKLVRKGLDALVANDLTAPGAGFGVDTNEVSVLLKDGTVQSLRGTKREVADRLWAVLVPLMGGAC
jgi:phosphopantothenoylcysteine decarboxylase/phosphopantothenate--cysteine ligase